LPALALVLAGLLLLWILEVPRLLQHMTTHPRYCPASTSLSEFNSCNIAAVGTSLINLKRLSGEDHECLHGSYRRHCCRRTKTQIQELSSTVSTGGRSGSFFDISTPERKLMAVTEDWDALGVRTRRPSCWRRLTHCSPRFDSKYFGSISSFVRQQLLACDRIEIPSKLYPIAQDPVTAWQTLGN
jgi:hypothetical protein